jgi:hypothetical protein
MLNKNAEHVNESQKVEFMTVRIPHQQTDCASTQERFLIGEPRSMRFCNACGPDKQDHAGSGKWSPSFLSSFWHLFNASSSIFPSANHRSEARRANSSIKAEGSTALFDTFSMI